MKLQKFVDQSAGLIFAEDGGEEIGGFMGMSAQGEGGVDNVTGRLIMVAGWLVLFSMLAMIVFLVFWRSS